MIIMKLHKYSLPMGSTYMLTNNNGKATSYKSYYFGSDLFIILIINETNSIAITKVYSNDLNKTISIWSITSLFGDMISQITQHIIILLPKFYIVNPFNEIEFPKFPLMKSLALSSRCYFNQNLRQYTN